MIKHSETRWSKYSSDQMYSLVADINSYPSFIPWCSGIRVSSRKVDKDNSCEILEVDMRVSFKIFNETFSSTVVLNPGSKEITVKYLNGPFKVLNNKWSFVEFDSKTGCRIDFFVEFEFF